jgi:hypothetical protein
MSWSVSCIQDSPLWIFTFSEIKFQKWKSLWRGFKLPLSLVTTYDSTSLVLSKSTCQWKNLSFSIKPGFYWNLNIHLNFDKSFKSEISRVWFSAAPKVPHYFLKLTHKIVLIVEHFVKFQLLYALCDISVSSNIYHIYIITTFQTLSFCSWQKQFILSFISIGYS